MDTARELRQLLHTIPAPGDWSKKANCRGKDTNIFFAEKGIKVHEARTLCQECDVQKQCLAYGMRHRSLRGIFGGLTRDERKRLRRAA